MENTIKKYDKYLLLVAIAISVFLSNSKIQYTNDFHHWEMIGHSVGNIFSSVPYTELYMQYGLGMPVISGLIKMLFEFQSDRMIAGWISVVSYVSFPLAIYWHAKKEDIKYAILWPLAFIVFFPRIQYPWPDYLASSLIYIALLISTYATLTIVPVVLMVIAIFTREVVIFELIGIALILVCSRLFCGRYNSRIIFSIVIAIVLHAALLSIYLLNTNSFNEYLLQTFNLEPFGGSSLASKNGLLRFVYLMTHSSMLLTVYFYTSIVFFIFILYISFRAGEDYRINRLFPFCGLSLAGLVMTYHVPDLFRIQIYAFPGLLICLFVFLKYFKQKDHKFIYITFTILISIHLFSSFNIKDASGEPLLVQKKGEYQLISYFVAEDDFYFYKNLMLHVNDFCAVNKTVDPIFQLINPNLAYSNSIPFYSDDFIKRIPIIDKKKKCDYLTYDKIQGCNDMGSLSDKVPFLGGVKVRLCSIK